LERVLKRLLAVRRPRDLYVLLRAPFLIAWRRLVRARWWVMLGELLAALWVALHVRHLHGPVRLPLGPEQLVVVSLVRDGAAHVRGFIEHYLALGAAWIVILDNGSRDETVALARGYPQVTVLSCRLPYREFQRHMKSYLIRRFGRGRWSLCVDIDELFDYPGSAAIGLPAFLRYLRGRGYNAVVAQMLDMVAPGPLRAPHVRPGEPLRRAYPLSDLSAIAWHAYGPIFGLACAVANPAIQVAFGGVRKTLFDSHLLLTKHPLLFLEGRMQPNTHVPDPLRRMDPVAVQLDGATYPLYPYQHGVSGASVADVSCVLYHYKFTAAFPEQVRRAVAEENYFGRSGQYKRYQAALERNPELGLDEARAWPPRDADELVELGFLQVSPAYHAWVEQHGEAVETTTER
jgi:hypothetical protein